MSGYCGLNPENYQDNDLEKLEKRTLSRLKKNQSSVSSKNISDLKQYFISSRDISVKISEVSLNNLRESQWALLGINQRAYQLTMATIQQLNEGNFVACGHCIRGIIETFSSIVWVEKKQVAYPR